MTQSPSFTLVPQRTQRIERLQVERQNPLGLPRKHEQVVAHSSQAFSKNPWGYVYPLLYRPSLWVEPTQSRLTPPTRALVQTAGPPEQTLSVGAAIVRKLSNDVDTQGVNDGNGRLRDSARR